MAVRGMYYLPYRASLKGEFRYYTDTWGVDGWNAEVAYVHPLQRGITLEGKYRFYTQGAADFYSDLFPFVNAQNFLARDKELSTFNSLTVGAGVSYEFPTKDWGFIEKGSVNFSYRHIQFDYDDFRNIPAGGLPGSEPLYTLEADVIQLYLSLWY